MNSSYFKRSDRRESIPSLDIIRPWTGWKPQRWAVIGGSGFVGSSLTEYLRERGIQVETVEAPRLSLEPVPSSVDEVMMAVSSKEDDIKRLSSRLSGIDVVVNAAGLALPDSGPTPALYGANSLLPAVVAAAASLAEVGRVVHISSAAVQGDRRSLDVTRDTSPFSPYSHSKALGEGALLDGSYIGPESVRMDLIVVRATSVQGNRRATTKSLRRIASSPFASVAKPGDRQSVVSSVHGLSQFVYRVGVTQSEIPAIVLQPWEGLTVSQVLQAAGSRAPVQLPSSLCRTVVFCGYLVGRGIPKLAGVTRRLDLMWFGQSQPVSGGEWSRPVSSLWVREALSGRSQR